MKIVGLVLLLALASSTAHAEDNIIKIPDLRLHLDATSGRVLLAPDIEGHCIYLDARQTFWGTMSVLATALTGTTGLSSLAIGSDHPNWKVTVAISTVILGALGSTSAYLTSHYSSMYKGYGCIPPVLPGSGT